MALVPATLEQTLKAALDKAAASEEEKARADLAKDLATAIDAYIKTAQVAPGIPVTTAGSAAAQTGATTGPGTLI